MMRRLLRCALLLAFLSGSLQPAYADNNGNGQGGGNGNGNGHSDDGSPGSGDGAGNSENAASVRGNSSDHGLKKGRKADEDVALDAVQADAALPLRDILRELRKTTSDKVIDARLFSRDGVLVYELKVLASSGRVGVYRYDASSGRQISSN